MTPMVGLFPDIDKDNNKISLNKDYYNAIVDSGGLPVIIPYIKKHQVLDIINRLDGVVFSGGNDIDPMYIGEEPIPESGVIVPIRDEVEITIAKFCLQNDIPALGICRGLQIMAVAAGCDFYQDIYKQHNNPVFKHMQQAPRWYGTHTVKINKDSLLYKIIKNDRIIVNSFHHQAVRKTNDQILISAISEDGIIEAVEHKTHTFYLGVQWHPENMTKYSYHSDIFKNFILCTKNKSLTNKDN